MECVWFIRGHLYELSGCLNYPDVKLTDLYCIGFLGRLPVFTHMMYY